MKKEGFALDRILFLRLRLSLKPANKVFSKIITAQDLDVSSFTGCEDQLIRAVHCLLLINHVGGL